MMRELGTGVGKDYIPYISTAKLNSLGTTSVIRDWKTGRGVHCLSQGEAYWYYVLRWDDDNMDIREQYPLNVEETNRIAEANGFRPPQNGRFVMTTDFLVTKADNTFHAYSVKTDRNLSRRSLELLCIEKIYWESRGIPFTLLFKVDVNKILATNIRLVTEFYDAASVFDSISAIKHKVANKEWKVDMEKAVLQNSDLLTLMNVIKNQENLIDGYSINFCWNDFGRS